MGQNIEHKSHSEVYSVSVSNLALSISHKHCS